MRPTLLPSGDQSHLSGFFSNVWLCPTNTFTQRFAGAYGRMSHARSVLSCAHRCTALLKPLTSVRLPEIEATS